MSVFPGHRGIYSFLWEIGPIRLVKERSKAMPEER